MPCTPAAYEVWRAIEGYYPQGPAGFYPGFSFHGGTLYPDTRFETEEEAARVVKFMNYAYQEGYAFAQMEIRKALGIKF